MDIDITKVAVEVKTLSVDGKRLTRAALGNLLLVDVNDISRGVRSGRCRFIAKFPIEIYARLAVAKEKVLPVQLVLPSERVLSVKGSTVAGVLVFDSELNALVVGWFADGLEYENVVEVVKRHNVFECLAGLCDAELLVEFKASTNPMLHDSGSPDFNELMFLCEKFSEQSWGRKERMSYVESEVWWLDRQSSELDQEHCDLGFGSVDLSYPDKHWLAEKIDFFWERCRGECLSAVAAEESRLRDEKESLERQVLMMEESYLSCPFLYF